MEGHGQHGRMESGTPYRRLLVMVALSFASMYALMYAMVDTMENVLPNVNQLYMAALMTGAMVIIELAVMSRMYPDKRVNGIVLGLGAAVLVASWLAIRQQALVTDSQFLKSMIPHHGGAILMCEQAPIEDAEIATLCRSIVASQQAEIAQMKAKLEELEGR